MDGGDAEAENRELAPFPTLDGTWASIAALPAGLDAWFEDHFGFRVDARALVRREPLLRARRLAVADGRPRQGRLALLRETMAALDDYTNEHAAAARRSRATGANAIVRARDWCRAHGIAYVFTIAPDKHVDLSGALADDDRVAVSRVTRTDQIFTATLDTGVVRRRAAGPARGQAARAPLHVTDTHWNDRGAFVAYQQIIDAVRRAGAGGATGARPVDVRGDVTRDSTAGISPA